MKRGARVVVAVVATLLAPALAHSQLVVGSKAFPESWILGEALAELARDAGVTPVAHRANLGGTEIVWQALTSGAIDVYPEYTGTIAEVLLASPGRATLGELRAGLASRGIAVSEPLGFNDGYGLAMARARADALGIRAISDLARHPELRLALTHEFLGRADGWPGLARRYGLECAAPRGIQHELAYQAVASGEAEGIDVYTTDAQIEHLGLVVLDDDRGFFPRYDAVWLYRADLERREPRALGSMNRLIGRIDEAAMTRANARVVLDRVPYATAARELITAVVGAEAGAPSASAGWRVSMVRNVLRHLWLVGVSLAAAVAVGVPLGVAADRWRAVARTALGLTGLVQTVPSLALLALLIPLLGIGAAPALVALFLYSLLPIVRNTYLGFTSIPVPLRESADAIGLSSRARLLRVHLPLAAPAILAGIKTAAVIDVGAATLAALVGAGGLGDPILAGIQLRRADLILEGALPAAALALLVQWSFDGIERLVVPGALREHATSA